jgi:hypothetical protein
MRLVIISLWYFSSQIKKCFLHHQVVSDDKIISTKNFLSKIYPIGVISGVHDIPVPRLKKSSLHHQVVLCVKINDARNFLMKSYPHKYIFNFELWLVLFKPPITGVFNWLPVNRIYFRNIVIFILIIEAGSTTQ